MKFRLLFVLLLGAAFAAPIEARVQLVPEKSGLLIVAEDSSFDKDPNNPD